MIEVRAERSIPAAPDVLWPLRGLVIRAFGRRELSRSLQDSLERLAAATT